MAYDHTEKVGNEGDVVKHAVLAAITAKLFNASDPDAIFSYIETHAGYSEYTLPKREGNRELGWEKGIKKLASLSATAWPDVLHPYRDAVLDQAINEARRGARSNDEIVRSFDRYPGSSALVFKLIRNRGAFNFILHDINPSAIVDLCLYFPFWESVKVRREDGLDAIRTCNSESLVLIDPPDLKQMKEILDAIAHAKDQGSSIIAWTPRIGNSAKPTTEGADYVQFREQAKVKLGIDPILVRWHDSWRTETCGCCLHVHPRELHELASQVVNAVRSLMKWHEE